MTNGVLIIGFIMLIFISGLIGLITDIQIEIKEIQQEIKDIKKKGDEDIVIGK